MYLIGSHHDSWFMGSFTARSSGREWRTVPFTFVVAAAGGIHRLGRDFQKRTHTANCRAIQFGYGSGS